MGVRVFPLLCVHGAYECVCVCGEGAGGSEGFWGIRDGVVEFVLLLQGSRHILESCHRRVVAVPRHASEVERHRDKREGERRGGEKKKKKYELIAIKQKNKTQIWSRIFCRLTT